MYKYDKADWGNIKERLNVEWDLKLSNSEQWEIYLETLWAMLLSNMLPQYLYIKTGKIAETLKIRNLNLKYDRSRGFRIDLFKRVI